MDKLPPLFIDADAKLEPAQLAGLFSRNPSLMYQWAQMGRLPDFTAMPVTYRQAIDHILTSLLREEEVKKLKVLEATKLKEVLETKKLEIRSTKRQFKSTDESSEDYLHPLVAEKIRQSVKTEYAREAELWQRIAIKNGEFVNFAEKMSIVEPFVLQIRDLLLGLALEYPETQLTIDECMENLHTLGMKLIEEAGEDRETYVQDMLNRITDVDRIEEDGLRAQSR